jgi:hypothetical protein
MRRFANWSVTALATGASAVEFIRTINRSTRITSNTSSHANTAALRRKRTRRGRATSNLLKGTNLTGIDPETSQIVALFHPRQQLWAGHFAWLGIYIAGISPTGRATVRVLAMNGRHRLQLRSVARRHG